MAGNEVFKNLLDMRIPEVVVGLREAYRNADHIQGWLIDNPVVDGVDPLTDASKNFGYSEDEAQMIRHVFMRIEASELSDILVEARRFTGLS